MNFWVPDGLEFTCFVLNKPRTTNCIATLIPIPILAVQDERQAVWPMGGSDEINRLCPTVVALTRRYCGGT